jgi:hypothetical protein
VTRRIRARVLAAGAAALAALLAAGCGSSADAGTHDAAAPVVPDFPVPTSVSGVNGTSWAAVVMGGSAKQFNNFWELFARPAGSAAWKLATPSGVASNGGIATAPTGAQSAAMAFLPSQGLTFSPTSTTGDGGTSWSTAAPVSPGLAKSPDALAAGPGGKLLALTSAGQVESASSQAADWTPLASERSLAASPAGRACGLTGLTAVSWTPSGAAMLAGTCSKAGTAGIFTGSGSSWRAIGPALPGSLPRGPVEVIGLATSGTRTTAVLATGTGSAAGLVTAWSADGGSHWTLSPAVLTGTEPASSLAILADGSVAVVLAGNRGETIGWQAAGWQPLPALPAHTSTLAEGVGTGLDALVARGGTLTVWQLPAGGKSWTVSQRTQVSIPYGSSS